MKYALLFVGLVFLSYFLFEVAAGRRVHPAQYILIGVAQLVFYLLLLSIAERTGFDIAFAIAAVATVALISAYAGWVFESRRYGLRALLAFSVLYGLIYLLPAPGGSSSSRRGLGQLCSNCRCHVLHTTHGLVWFLGSCCTITLNPGHSDAGGE